MQRDISPVPLYKSGFYLFDASGNALCPGDKVHVQCIRQDGILMKGGTVPEKLKRGYTEGTCLVKFDTLAIELYPELIGAQWLEPLE